MSEKTREASVINSQPDSTQPRSSENSVCRDNDAEESRHVI